MVLVSMHGIEPLNEQISLAEHLVAAVVAEVSLQPCAMASAVYATKPSATDKTVFLLR